jgi:tetratricopeptide (TPR) repeat protein
MLIGCLPLFVIWPIIPKLGNILALHILYFASIGICLYMAQLGLRWVVLLFVLFAALTFYQGRFWTTEETLLRHTRSLEWLPRTVAAQQLLMRYDENAAAIKDLEIRSHDPLIKAMWRRRLGLVYFKHRNLSRAQEYFTQALSVNPSDVDSLNALAVVSHEEGQEAESLKYLDHALAINPYYPDTLRTLGIYYYIHKDFGQARSFLSRCLVFDPDNIQARQLLGLANKMI